MMDVVKEILEKSSQNAKNFKPTRVDKHLELQFDVGSLLAIDENEIDIQKLRQSTNSYLKELARDNTQLLINEIWKLPQETVDDVTVAKLPKPTFVLPRSQPVPKPRLPTKWEQFAKEKGIQKKRKDKLKWDDILKKWVPLHGFKRAQAEKQKDWVLEVPQNADPYEDQFEKKLSQKSEKVAKNEFQRLRNIAKSKNIKIPKLGFAPTDKPSAKQLGAALTVAKASTASLGKFQSKLPKEKQAKNVKQFLPETRKRKLPVPKPKDEKEQNLKMIDGILNKRPKLSLDQAVDKEVHKENREDALKKGKAKSTKAKRGGKTKSSAKGGKFRGPQKGGEGKQMKKGKGKGRGSVGGKKKGGRKRR